MATIQSTTATSSTSNNASSKSSASSADAINDIDLGTFLTLMIKELQNQDPLNPLENKDMLAQISQIREVGATDKLTQTLDSVLLGQNITSATNLIGADVTALSDDGETVSGLVNKISIDKGVPKLHIDNATGLLPSSADGEVDAGTHAYRVVWEDDKGQLFGLDMSGDVAIKTTGAEGLDRAIELRNLPVTSNAKQVYRTDASGTGDYQLVGTILDGKKGTFVDGLADSERSSTRLTRDFQRSAATVRAYEVSLNNISSVRPPNRVSNNGSTDNSSQTP